MRLTGGYYSEYCRAEDSRRQVTNYKSDREIESTCRIAQIFIVYKMTTNPALLSILSCLVKFSAIDEKSYESPAR